MYETIEKYPRIEFRDVFNVKKELPLAVGDCHRSQIKVRRQKKGTGEETLRQFLLLEQEITITRGSFSNTQKNPRQGNTG